MTQTKHAVTIGNFDGVHKGHRLLLSKLIEASDIENITPMIYTFSEHPINVLHGAGTVKNITLQAEQEQIFQSLGIDKVLYESFSSVKDLSPEQFVKEILLDKFSMTHAVIGENNRFGKNSEGDAAFLCALGKKHGFSVTVVPSLVIDGDVCSSSRIRDAIKKGNLKLANNMLGRPYTIANTVISGKKLGRTYGFPTANIVAPDEQILPKYGVYATEVYIGGEKYSAITNVGSTSFDTEKTERVESHLLDFDGTLYGKTIMVRFLERMRDSVRYHSVDELEKQLLKDRKNRINIQ